MPDDRPRVTDPYTGEDLGPAVPDRIQSAEGIDDGYSGKLNPVYRGLPYATLVVGPDGEIAAVELTRKHAMPEAELIRIRKEQARRQRRPRRKGPGDAPADPRPEASQVVDLMAALKSALLGAPAVDPAPKPLAPLRKGARNARVMQQPADLATGPAVAGSLSHDPPDGAPLAKDAHQVHTNLLSHKRGHNPMTPEAVPAVPAPKAPVTLYDLTQGLLAVEAFIDDHQEEIIAAGGDLDAVPGLIALLDQVEGRFHEKVEKVVLFIQNRATMEAGRRAEADRFKRLADADKRVIDSLKAYLVREQRRANRTKIETAHCRATVVRNAGPSIEHDVTADLGALYELAAFQPGSQAAADASVDGVPVASIMACIEQVQPPPVYRIRREVVLAVWKAAYQHARDTIAEEAAAAFAEDGRGMTEFDQDRRAHEFANRDPLLVALGVTVTQGYHVRLR